MTRSLVIIPGVQDTPAKTAATKAFLNTVASTYVCLEAHIPPYDPRGIRQFLTQLPSRDLVVIAFSAGVVGVAGALNKNWLQAHNFHIEALLALDGWLVPLFCNFPIYRLSHDWFTHQTSRPLGMGRQNFWAEPEVSHLDLWRDPGSAQGWVLERKKKTRTTALEFIQQSLAAHGLRG